MFEHIFNVFLERQLIFSHDEVYSIVVYYIMGLSKLKQDGYLRLISYLCNIFSQIYPSLLLRFDQLFTYKGDVNLL